MICHDLFFFTFSGLIYLSINAASLSLKVLLKIYLKKIPVIVYDEEEE